MQPDFSNSPIQPFQQPISKKTQSTDEIGKHQGRKVEPKESKNEKPIQVFEEVTFQTDEPEITTTDLGLHRLVKGTPASNVKANQEQYLIDLAIKLGQLKKPNVQDETKDIIAVQILNAFSTAATAHAEEYEIQTTPLFPKSHYHRSSSPLLDTVNKAFAEDMQLKDSGNEEMMLIHSPLFHEAFDREFPNPDLDLVIDSEEKFTALMEQLVNDAIQGKVPENKILIDFSKFLTASGKKPGEIHEIVEKFESIFWIVTEKNVVEAVEKQKNAWKQCQKIDSSIEKLRDQLQLIAFIKHEEYDVLITPKFLTGPKEIKTAEYTYIGANFGTDEEPDFETMKKNSFKFYEALKSHSQFFSEMKDLSVRSGHVLAPHDAKKAWLKVKDIQSILTEIDIPLAQLATKGPDFPKVFDSYKDLLNTNAMREFRKLKEVTYDAAGNPIFIPPPYLKILSEATAQLLDGLAECKIDEIFHEKALTDLLQISYFRLHNALADATLRKNDIEFADHMQIIYQVIQDILAIVEPYKDEDHVLANCLIEKMTKSPNPLIPKGLDTPKIHLMPSAMHCVASAIAGVEAQEGTNKLNVVILKDSYYESASILTHAKTQQVSVLDGDHFNAKGINWAFDQPPKNIHLFLCEFHHNISTTRVKYQPENILEQLKAMVDKGLVANKFTIIIDTTINLEQSEEVRDFLKDEKIQKLIQNGNLNVVLIRSAQKFDMLGMDNYYGGIAVAINNHQSFHAFNKRMDAPEDQLQGLNYQGLSHLQKYAGSNLDEYRQAIMLNTQKLYKQIAQVAKAAIYYEGSTNPIQISQIHDPSSVFLDIKFPGFEKTAKAFFNRLVKFALTEDLPLSKRASFGFPNSNFISISGEKYRFTPGLEDDTHLQRYAYFFQAVQKTIVETMKTNPSLDQPELDQKLANALVHCQT